MGIKTLGAMVEFGIPWVSEKPPHHMGIKTFFRLTPLCTIYSEKPPHHMGIKTVNYKLICKIHLL